MRSDFYLTWIFSLKRVVSQKCVIWEYYHISVSCECSVSPGPPLPLVCPMFTGGRLSWRHCNLWRRSGWHLASSLSTAIWKKRHPNFRLTSDFYYCFEMLLMQTIFLIFLFWNLLISDFHRPWLEPVRHSSWMLIYINILDNILLRIFVCIKNLDVLIIFFVIYTYLKCTWSQYFMGSDFSRYFF